MQYNPPLSVPHHSMPTVRSLRFVLPPRISVYFEVSLTNPIHPSPSEERRIERYILRDTRSSVHAIVLPSRCLRVHRSSERSKTVLLPHSSHHSTRRTTMRKTMRLMLRLRQCPGRCSVSTLQVVSHTRDAANPTFYECVKCYYLNC